MTKASLSAGEWVFQMIGAVAHFERSLGTIADLLLGITGAFAARWFIDVFRQIGLNVQSYSWVFVLCGAALPRWGFRRLRRRIQIHQSRWSRRDSQASRQVASSQANPEKIARNILQFSADSTRESPARLCVFILATAGAKWHNFADVIPSTRQ